MSTSLLFLKLTIALRKSTQAFHKITYNTCILVRSVNKVFGQALDLVIMYSLQLNQENKRTKDVNF